VLCSGLFGKALGFRFAPGQDQAQVALTIELPAGASLAATERVLRQIEDSVRDMPDVKYVETSAGGTSSGGFSFAGSTGTNFGQVRLTLLDKLGVLDRMQFWKDHSDLRVRTDVEVAQDVRKRVADIVGAKISTAEVSGFQGAAAPVQIEIVGPDLPELVRVSEKVRDMLGKTPGVLLPDTSYDAARPEAQVRVDRDRAAEYGLSVAQVSQALRDSIEGNIDAKYREAGEEYPIRVQYSEVDRNAVEEVGDVIVGSRQGAAIRLRDVANIEDGRGPTKIDRKNRQRQITATAYLAPGRVIGNMQQVIEPRLKQIEWGRATYRWGGEANTMAEEGPFMLAALGLAILLVYMLMAALFNNYLYPFIIMLSIPQALVGGLLGLLVTGTPLSIIAMIGVIMLMGLVTKNAILLVDYTNTLRARGYRREDAIQEAGPTRLRPIIMTTLAQILGALPIALALGRGAEFRAPLGIVIVGGLMLSSLLTLLVIPCSYTVFDDISNWFSRVTHRRRADVETLLAEEEPGERERQLERQADRARQIVD
jgi:HAE1 family hydrophobic/amphiphilic exporter-1